MGSNHGPKRYQHFALPTELLSLICINGVTGGDRTHDNRITTYGLNHLTTATIKLAPSERLMLAKAFFVLGAASPPAFAPLA